MIIEKNYLNIIINELYLRGNRDIVIKYPPIGILFKAQIMKDKISIIPISESDYAEKRYSLKIYGDTINEIPSPSEYRMILYSTNICKMENYNDLVSELERLAKRDLLKGNRPLYIGYDTNALRHRVPTILAEILKKIREENVGYILLTGIKDELQPLWDKKFNMNSISNLKRELKSNEFDKFLNQPPLTARLHKIGAIEYRKVKSMYYAYEIESDKGDTGIIKAISEYSKKNNVDILFISEDNNIIEAIRENRILAYHIKQPKNIEKNIEVDWGSFINLILISALVFGYIIVDKIKIFGIWIGKTGDNWNTESLKIEIGSETLKREIERDINILQHKSV